MGIISRLTAALAIALLLMGTALCSAAAQVDRRGRSRPTTSMDEGIQQKMERERQKQYNKRRQEDLKRDTDKLLQLATELKLYVDKTNEDVMSLDVIKKASEIEKLSKEVQKKMRAQ